MCYGFMYGRKNDKPTDTTKDMLKYICGRCGIHHEAVCSRCKVKQIAKIEMSEDTSNGK